MKLEDAVTSLPDEEQEEEEGKEGGGDVELGKVRKSEEVEEEEARKRLEDEEGKMELGSAV